jgi:hypothetical protein
MSRLARGVRGNVRLRGAESPRLDGWRAGAPVGQLRTGALGCGVIASLMFAWLAFAIPSEAHSRPPTRALVLKGADSPVLDALTRRHGVHVERARSGRVAGPKRHQMLIVDGDVLSPGQLAQSKMLGRFARAHRSVLALDVGTRHHRRALEDLTGFAVTEGGGTHSSDAFFFRRGAVESRSPQTKIVEAPQLKPRGSKRIGPRKRAKLVRRHASRVADIVHPLVRRQANRAPATAAAQGASLPPELQHVGWTYSVVGHASPPDGFWTQNKKSGYSYQDPGKQTASWTMNHQLDLYLDNNPANQASAHHQVLTYALDGQVAPKYPQENFFHMADKFAVGASDSSYNLERAWWTGMIGVEAEPEAVTDPKLVWQASSPQSPNEEHEYTAGQDWTIGFSGSEKGPEVSLDFSFHNEQVSHVPDWGVGNETSGNRLAWLFSSRAPCDPRPDHYNVKQCFNDAFASDLTPHQPNELSTGQMQVHTTGRWNTTGLLTGSNAELGLSLDTPITLVDTYCEAFAFGACLTYGSVGGPEGRHLNRFQVGPEPRQVTIDASQVVPVGIKSLELYPGSSNTEGPADGSKNEVVTGVVMLKDDAPRDTPIKVFSDSPNASVGAPIAGRGSETTITVNEGFKRGYFEVRTNDNALEPGKRTTADITAFYAGATTKQIRICAGTPPC